MRADLWLFCSLAANVYITFAKIPPSPRRRLYILTVIASKGKGNQYGSFLQELLTLAWLKREQFNTESFINNYIHSSPPQLPPQALIMTSLHKTNERLFQCCKGQTLNGFGADKVLVGVSRHSGDTQNKH